ncbi:MAG: porin [Alphaproteobacteria bacterium]|nr:porin [Alphaproteobacteria bacterium]MDB5739084.1 porin [Alphaproteobacteria bacterium]
MKIGTLMASVAVIAMAAAASAQAAETNNDSKDSNVERPNLVVAQLNTPSGGSISNAELAARIQALEDAQTSATDRATADRTRLSTLEQGYNSAVWAFDNGRPTFASGDGRFTLAIRARVQADFAGYSQDSTHPAGFAGPSDLSSGSVVRRAYFGIEGKAYSDFSYELRFNAGGSDGGSFGASGVPNAGEGDPLLNKAVISYTGIPNVHINVGVLEPAFMMEGTTSSANLMFMERPDFENIAADTFGAGDSRRGVEVGWAKTDTFWAGDNVTATATFSGGKTGSAQNHGSVATAGAPGNGDENTQVLGRVTDRFWSDGISNFQIGGSFGKVLYSGSNGNADGGSQSLNLRDRPEIRVDGTRLIATGGINAKTADMWAVDLEGNFENFYIGGEYAQFSIDRQCGAIGAATGCTTSTNVADHPKFYGWAVEGSWILTGETKAYSASALNNEVGGFQGPIPSRPFSLSGGSWGAWELVARYTDTNLNWNSGQLAIAGTQLAGVLGGEERIAALGVNWYLNRNIRIMLQDNIVSVSKGTAALPDRDSQDFNVLGLRFQYAN